MSSRSKRTWMAAVLGQLGWPLIMGSAASVGFYALVLQGPLRSDVTLRYFAGHPVSVCATAMFFVGMAALLLKATNTLGQFGTLGKVSLGLEPDEQLACERASELIDHLDQRPAAQRQSYLGRRLRNVLDFIRGRNSSAGLEDELKYLADVDAARQQDSYALVRIIIWATPMLGFLGTVIGITQALGDLDPNELATSVQTAMDKLLSGLYVAFDTTALALTLSIILMFVQFLVDRIESQLLGLVDAQTNDELRGRFQEIGTGRDPYLSSVERMGQAVIRTAEVLVHQQAQVWKSSLEESQQQFAQHAEANQEALTTSMSQALSQSLGQFQQALVGAEQEASERAGRRWEQWQTALSENSRVLYGQQQEMVKQGELLGQVLAATGQVIKLEEALNDNLRALSGVQQFEEMVMSLSAAINLLTSRLGHDPAVPRVDIQSKPGSQDRAA